MTLDDLRAALLTATDRFRLETLPQYLVPQEEVEFAEWKRGVRDPLATPETDSWLASLRDTTAAGGRWWRVRIVDYPLVEYSKYELYGLQANAAAGEEIYVANRAWHQDLTEMNHDFWILDHEVIVHMIYDDEGHFLRPEKVDRAGPYLNARDAAYRQAIPLADYLNKYEPDLKA